MKIYKTRVFARWAKKSAISRYSLLVTAKETEQGKIEAYYGCNLYKKRIANKARGKSASTRVLLCYEKNNRLFFLYGFEKSERENITLKEKKALQILTRDLMALSDHDINVRLDVGSLIEVKDE